MENFDFKTKSEQERGDKIAQDIFSDFDDVKTEFTEYGTMKVTVDEVFDFSFISADILLQTKRIVKLLDFKKLDRLCCSKTAEVR